MIHYFSWSESPLAYTLTQRKWEWESCRIYSYKSNPFIRNFPLQIILHLGQLPVNQALSAFGVTSQDVCPLSVKLSAVLPAGFLLSIINMSVDGQWTFYRGHFNETEQCLPCIYQWKTFSLVFYKFSHFPSECWKSLPRKHKQGDTSLSL